MTRRKSCPPLLTKCQSYWITARGKGESTCEQLRSGCCGRRPPARPLSKLWRAQPGRGRSAGEENVLMFCIKLNRALIRQTKPISKGMESNATRLLDHLRPRVFKPLFGDQGSRHSVRIVARLVAVVNLFEIYWIGALVTIVFGSAFCSHVAPDNVFHKLVVAHIGHCCCYLRGLRVHQPPVVQAEEYIHLTSHEKYIDHSTINWKYSVLMQLWTRLSPDIKEIKYKRILCVFKVGHLERFCFFLKTNTIPLPQ